MHVDTVGVMKSLPQKQLIDTINGKSPYEGEQLFPDCDLLPPNTASLRGFRALLLHRKRLSEQIEQSSQDVNNRSLHDTQIYEALQKRFKSIFLWPAFLSIFMPKLHGAEETPEKTPSKLPQLNLNKRMNLRGRLIPQNLIKTPIGPEDSNQITHSINSQWSIPGTSFLHQINSPSEKVKDRKVSNMDNNNFATPNFHKTTSCFEHKERKTEEKRRVTPRKESKEKIPRPDFVKNHDQKEDSNDNKIRSRRNKLSDEKLSLLVNDYISERKIQDNTSVAALAAKSNLPLNIVKIRATVEKEQLTQEKSLPCQKKTFTARKTIKPIGLNCNSNVFIPRRVLEPPGEKRAMLENSVGALDTNDDGKAPLKKFKKN